MYLEDRAAADSLAAEGGVTACEPGADGVALAAMQERGGIIEKYGAVDTSAYDALLVPLYPRLGPDALAPVARAYSRLHIFKDKPLIIATEHRVAIDDGLQALIRYASKDLGIVLKVPD